MQFSIFKISKIVKRLLSGRFSKHLSNTFKDSLVTNLHSGFYAVQITEIANFAFLSDPKSIIFHFYIQKDDQHIKTILRVC